MFKCIQTNNRHLGFSLVEVMIALLIFAIVTMMCAKGINSIMLIKQKQNTIMNNISEQQMIHVFLKKDLSQAVNRPVRINNTITPAFIGGTKATQPNELFELTRTGISNPNIQTKALSSLRRVGYFLKDNTLIRKNWQNINKIQTSKPSQRVLSRKIKSIKIKFSNSQNQLSNNWRSIYPVNLNTIGKSWQLKKNPLGLPTAIQIKLMMQDNSQLTWWFLLPTVNDHIHQN